MKKINIAILSVFALLVIFFVAILVLPNYINWNNNKNLIESFLKSYSGYDIQLDGNVEIQVLPNPRLYAENVTVKGFSGEENLVKLHHIVLYKNLKQLLSFDFSVDELVMNRPEIKLLVAKDNTKNWEPLKIRNTSYYSRRINGFITKLKTFKKVKVENAIINYENLNNDKKFDISDVYVDMERKKQIIELDSRFKIFKKNHDLNLNLDFSSFQTLRVQALLNAEGHTLKSNGVLRNYQNLSDVMYVGKLLADIKNIDSIHLLNKNILKELKKYINLDKMDFSSDMTLKKDKIAFSRMKLESEKDVVKGSLEWLKSSENKSSFNLNLDIDTLFMNQLDKNNVKDWSSWLNTKLDFSFINNLVASSVISCSKCYYGNKEFKDVSFRASLENNSLIVNQLSLKTDESSAFNATAIASLNSPVGIEIKQEFKNFPISEFSPSLIDDNMIFDTTGKLGLSSTGTTVKDLLSNLKGSFSLDLNNIKLLKINTSNLTTMLESFLLNKNKISTNSDVSDTSIEGIIRDGVVRHSDIDFSTKGVDYRSKGKFDIVNMTLNYRFAPVQLTRNNLGVIVKGRLNKPEIIEDKVTPKGVIDGYGRIVTTEIKEGNALGNVKTPFDYNDKENLKENVVKYLFDENGNKIEK